MLSINNLIQKSLLMNKIQVLSLLKVSILRNYSKILKLWLHIESKNYFQIDRITHLFWFSGNKRTLIFMRKRCSLLILIGIFICFAQFGKCVDQMETIGDYFTNIKMQNRNNGKNITFIIMI